MWWHDDVKEWKSTMPKPTNNDNREREREREQIQQRIRELENITNRTPQQQQELDTLKGQLAQLESKTNWTPWLIGGGIILVLIVGIIVYHLGKSNKNKKRYRRM